MQASAHLVGHRVEYLRRFNAPRHQRAHSAQRGLFGGEPAILGVQLRIIDGHGEFVDRKFVGV